MLKLVCAILVFFILTSCNQLDLDKTYEAKNVSMHSSSLNPKKGIPLAMTKQERLQRIGANMYSFVQVSEWFNNDTILYLTDESGASLVYKFHILTEEEEIFFKLNDSITQITTNPDHSIFVMDVAAMRGLRELYFVNRDGDILYILDEIDNELQIYWNPYKEYELVVASLQDDFSIKLDYLNLKEQSLTDFDFDHYYLQWIGEDELAYLNWNQFAVGYYAPLYTFHVQDQVEEKLADEIIAFFSFKDYLLTISIEDTDVTKSNYTFYHSETRTKTSKLEVPILNTYSEQWWIPNHDFDQVSQSFYYVRPNQSGDMFDYSDGFTIMSFQVDSGKTKEIALINHHFPIKISPDGRWLLYGYQLENIIDLKNRDIHSLLHW